MIAKEFMRHPVITISPEAGLDRALVIMRTQRIRHLPVVDDKRDLVGLITDRDLRLSMEELSGPHSAPKGLYLPALTKVKSVMKTHVYTALLDTTAAEATKKLLDNKIGCLPVLEANTKNVIGIITETDMLRLLSRILKEKGN